MQLDELRKTTPRDVETTLKELPSSLVAMYDHQMHLLGLSTEPAKRKASARTILQIFEVIYAAKQPLRVTEAAEIFTLRPHPEHDVIIDPKYRSQDPAGDLIRVCTSQFIRIENEYVQFAHASVLDYLLDNRLAAIPYLDKVDADIMMAKLCLATIYCQQTDKTGPFDQYVERYGDQHIKDAFAQRSYKSVESTRALLDAVLLHSKEEHQFLSQSPIHLASAWSLSEYVLRILDNGTSPNQCNKHGETALHVASYHGHLDVVQLLIKHHTDVNCTNKAGTTALHKASYNGHRNVVHLLIEHQADVSCTDNFGETALHYAARWGHLDVVQLLIDNQADVNCTDTDGETPLHKAAEAGHLDAVRLLIEHQADVNYTDENGDTALHWASYTDHLDVVQLLIAHQADINIANADGKTALAAALLYGYTDIIDCLNQHGAH